MELGRSQYYDEAITWLEKSRDAHVAAGREEEWRDYLDDLVSRHQRKCKLRPMLQELAQGGALTDSGRALLGARPLVPLVFPYGGLECTEA